MTKFLVILLVVLFILKESTVEYPDSTLIKIKSKDQLIKDASKTFDIDEEILSSIIYVERKNNYNWEDDAMDVYLAEIGVNSSIGFCQVKLKTAYWIEAQLNDTASIYFPAKKYYNLLELSKSSQEIINKLTNDSLNINYAAAYLRIMLSRWESEGFPIDSKPEILGTLYSTGLFYKNGKERKPNKNPKENWFGSQVKEHLSRFR